MLTREENLNEAKSTTIRVAPVDVQRPNIRSVQLHLSNRPVDDQLLNNGRVLFFSRLSQFAIQRATSDCAWAPGVLAYQ